MPSITYPFTTPANYIYTAADIEVVGGKAQLVQQVSGGQIFNQPFDSDAGFVYDSAKAEFTGGLVRQIGIAAATFGANYNTDIDGTWGDGVLTGTATGGATVSGGKLDLKGGTKGMQYDADLNADSAQVGAARLKVTPNWSGTPAASRIFVGVLRAVGDPDNLIAVWQKNTGQLNVLCKTATGATFINVDLGLWVPVAGTEYEFELNYDFTLGETRLFVDGGQFGTTMTGTGTRDANSTVFSLGLATSGTPASDHEVDDVMAFSLVQHTADYTPGYTVADTKFQGSMVELPEFVHAGVGAIISLDGMTTTEVGTPRYIFELNTGGYMYWNGAAWVASDMSYAQANDVATANTNLPTYPLAGETTLHVHIIFQDDTIQSSVADLTVQHTANTVYTLTNPSIRPTTAISQDAILSFLATLTAAGGDAVRFTLRLGSQDKYWDGGAWSDADGTYTQTNDLATIQANIATWSDRGDVVPKVFLHTNDGTTTPTIDLITISFDYYGGSVTPENVSKIWMYIYDEENNPRAGIEVDVQPTIYGNAGDKFIDMKKTTLTTDASGYAEIDLIETDSIVDTDFGYEFTIKEPPEQTYRKYVPDVVSNNVLDLPDMP